MTGRQNQPLLDLAVRGGPLDPERNRSAYRDPATEYRMNLRTFTKSPTDGLTST